MVLLGRTYLNSMQYHALHRHILILNPLISKCENEETVFYFKVLKISMQSYYSIVDSAREYEKLFEELLSSQYYVLTFRTGCNLIFSYIKHNDMEKGIALFHELGSFIDRHSKNNEFNLYLYYMHGFTLFFSQRDEAMCDRIIELVETSPQVKIMDSFRTTYDLCKTLHYAQKGQLDEAMAWFEKVLENISYLKVVKTLFKLWIRTLEELDLTTEVIKYQKLMIDILEEDYTAEVKRLRHESIETTSRQFYEAQMYIDQLTGVNNRNYFENTLSKTYQVKYYCVAVLDIDKFKLVNDTYGHPVGDEAIKFIASHLLKWCPKHDVRLIRYGGDEFIILMPYSIEKMHDALVQLHETIMSTSFFVRKLNVTIPISISMGVCYANDQFATIHTLFEQADAAIYEAKKHRGSVVFREVL